MSKVRTLSPRFVKAWKAADEKALAARAVVSRSYWLGPQDHDACRGDRLRQMLGFGLVDDADLRAAIEDLEKRDGLLEPTAIAAELDPAHPAEREQLVKAQARLGALVHLAETIGGDLGALGTRALAATRGGLAERLGRIQGELETIADELEAARAPFVAEQTARLGLAGARDLKVHLGAGPSRLDGWVNHDVGSSELSFHLSWGLPFDDGSVAFAYAGHVFEHLYYATEAGGLLREIKRVLRPGGVFRFLVPDMGLFLRKYAEGDRGFFEHWRATAPKYFALFDTPMEMIMMYSMVGRDLSELFGHKMGYDFETLDKLARSAGFATVTRSDFMASAHPELRVDEVCYAAHMEYQGDRYTLFVELTA